MRLTLALLVALALAAATVLGVATLLGLSSVLGDGGRQSSWRPVGELVGLAVVWLLANSVVEGRVLWVPVEGHGLTVADLAAVPPLLVAAALALARVS